jgi:beta-hydroxyacyl-ACP dehydratase FabZ
MIAESASGDGGARDAATLQPPMATGGASEPLDARAIAKLLPHRYPFLLVDRVLELRDGLYARGLKNVSFNEEFFQGHFPGTPVMPGVLQIEAMAQLGGILLLSRPEYAGRWAYFLSADKVKFRRTVVPGDQLILEVNAKTTKSRTAEITARAFVEDSLTAEAKIRFMMVEDG